MSSKTPLVKTKIGFSEEQRERLQREADRSNVSVGHVVRVAVDNYFKRGK